MKTPPSRSRKSKTKFGELPQILQNNRGTAYMNFRGRRFYLGKFGSIEAEQERLRIIAEYDASASVTPVTVRRQPVTVAILVYAFLKWAKTHYVKHGRSTQSAERFGYSAQPLLELYADLPVTEFRPLALKAVRERMIAAGLCRKVVNQRIGFVKQIFKWGVGEEMVPPEIKAALYDVAGLREGETTAVDYPDIESVDMETVEKTLKHCHPVLADMVRIQMYGGMRPQDVCNMRLCDIDRMEDVWEYTPWEHKTEHHGTKGRLKTGKNKVVRWLGPKAQEILEVYLVAKEGTPTAYLFSPSDAMRLIQTEKRWNRKSKVQPSQTDRAKEHPMIKPGEKYKTGSYRNAIKRAAKKAGVEEWSPNRLRHTWATFVEEKYGPEEARIILGHRNVGTTQIYIDGERDRTRAREVARKIG